MHENKRNVLIKKAQISDILRPVSHHMHKRGKLLYSLWLLSTEIMYLLRNCYFLCQAAGCSSELCKTGALCCLKLYISVYFQCSGLFVGSSCVSKSVETGVRVHSIRRIHYIGPD